MKITTAIDRGRRLESEVLNVLEKQKGISFKNPGLLVCAGFPVFAASPDGLTPSHVIEVKCPSKTATVKYYVSKTGEVSKKVYGTMQLQMFLSGRQVGWLYVADPSF